MTSHASTMQKSVEACFLPIFPAKKISTDIHTIRADGYEVSWGAMERRGNHRHDVAAPAASRCRGPDAMKAMG